MDPKLLNNYIPYVLKKIGKKNASNIHIRVLTIISWSYICVSDVGYASMGVYPQHCPNKMCPLSYKIC